jgi:hypothetical protein
MAQDFNFDSLMIHSATLVKGQRATVPTSSSYGHQSVPIQTGGKMTPELSIHLEECLCRPQSEQEQQTQGKAAENTAYYVFYIPGYAIPTGLKAQDAAANWQVCDVYDQDGDLIDAGPFDVESIQVPAGRNHHMRLTIRRSIG